MSSTPREGHEVFAAWIIYRKVVENDYMDHAAVTRGVERDLGDAGVGLTVLDLGCGDAEVVSRLASTGQFASYVGVDQSAAALRSARQRLEGVLPNVDFDQTDLLDFVRTTSRRFDVVLCGYALHHLSTDEKRAFFRFVRRVLKPTGVLLVYDAFRPETETREHYLESYISWIADEWHEIRPEEHAEIASHMRTADRPETLGAFYQLAQDAGLRPTREPLWSCAQNRHHLVRITL